MLWRFGVEVVFLVVVLVFGVVAVGVVVSLAGGSPVRVLCELVTVCDYAL